MILWDYENVPLRHADWQYFYWGLAEYLKKRREEILAAYLFYGTGRLTKEDQTQLDKLETFQFVEVPKRGKNAVDNVLQKFAKDIVKDHPEIGQLILIAGDSDYLHMFNSLQSKDIRCALISQKRSLSRQMRKFVYYHSTVEEIARLPTEWWTSVDHIRDPYSHLFKEFGWKR